VAGALALLEIELDVIPGQAHTPSSRARSGPPLVASRKWPHDIARLP
jgi:hypothetical protein